MVSCFFFQAEDGIRDLVRSRGLGDVYKRQLLVAKDGTRYCVAASWNDSKAIEESKATSAYASPVSYTHLTLPTSDLV